VKSTHIVNPADPRDPGGQRLYPLSESDLEGFRYNDETTHTPRSVSGSACCAKAWRAQCVCSRSYWCPEHGYRCFGSHD